MNKVNFTEEIEKNKERLSAKIIGEDSINSNVAEIKTNKEETKIEEKNELETKKEIKNHKEDKKEAKEQIKSKTTNIGKAITILMIIIICGLLLSTIFAIMNMGNSKIMSGIKINNISVKDLTKEEAVIFIQNEMQKNQEIIVNVDGKYFSIIKENLNITYNIKDAVEEAYTEGRNGNIFENNFTILINGLKGKNIKTDMTIDEKSLKHVANEICLKIPNGLKESTYCIEDDKLIIKEGEPGKGFDLEEFETKIIEYIQTNGASKIEIKTINKKPEAINIEEIREEIYKEPKDAYYEEEPFKIYSSENGIDIDIDEAKKILSEEKQEYEIPLIITEAKVKKVSISADKQFLDLLGKCTTKYDESNVSRSTNLKVASKTINEMIINPGEIFSFNNALGPRTVAKGYKLGAGYSGGRSVSMVGGGICQISSTLYNAAIYANLTIVERHNHAHIAAYLDPGKDATVSYGTLDFKFKNTREEPIMIKASAKNGIATVEIYGKKESDEYDIEIVSIVSNYIGFKTIYEYDSTKEVGYQKVTQQGMRGCNSTTYKIYSKNGIEIKREQISKDYFAPMNKYITVGTKETVVTPTEPVTPAIPEEPVKPTTPEETETEPEPEKPEETGESETLEDPTEPETSTED